MPKLKWISDDILSTEVRKLLNVAKKAKTQATKNFGSNVVDPFSAVFEIAGFEIDYDKWKKSEEQRQAQKTLQNSIGEFHQTILGSCRGWENLGKGKIVDLINRELEIVAEVKNKFNTLSGGKLIDLYTSFDNLVMPKSSIYKGYKAYYVTIIPKSSVRQDVEFIPSDKSKGTRVSANSLIRKIDGASFYSIVAGEDDALEQLFDVIPSVILEITGKKIDSANVKKLFQIAYS